MNDDFLYVQVYKNLFKEIEDQVYKVGDKLPTEKQISEKYNVSRITAQRAMNMLMEDGIIARYSGIGSFVVNKDDKDSDSISIPKKSIGMVVESICSSFGIRIFDGAYKMAEELGYNLILKKSYGNQKSEVKAIEELIELGASGIIIMPVHGDYYSDRILKLFVEGYPIVFLDRYLHGVHIPFVSSDNVLAVKKAFSYFVDNGHKHIGLVTTPDKETTTLDDRKQGFVESTLEKGLQLSMKYIYDEVENRIPGSTDNEVFNSTIKKIRDYLNTNNKITAIVASEHYMAELVRRAITDIGKRVPEDIEIICFDSPESILSEYSFTHIRQNENEMGRRAVEMLNNVIVGQEQEERILLDTELRLGRSTKGI